MGFDVGLAGLGVLLAFSLGFGIAAQILTGRRAHTTWMWLIAATGWFIGGLIASEVVWGGMTVEEVQPIIDGLALDESMLGGLIGGLCAVVITLLATRGATSHRPMSPTQRGQTR